MAENGKSRQLIAKAQAVVGTYGAPDYTSDQDVLIYALDDGSNDFGHTGGADNANGLFTKGRSYSQQKTHTRSFQVDMQPSSALAVEPKWWKFLKGCGFSTSLEGANKDEVGVTNALAYWSGRPACQTLDIDLPQWNCEGGTGTAFIMSSATGSFEMSWDNSGGVLMPTFAYTGKYGGFKDLAANLFALPAGNDTTPCSTFLGATVTFGGQAHNVWAGSITQSADNQIIPKSDDLTNSIKTGVSHVAVKGADVQATFTVERIDKASYDYETDITGNVVFSDIEVAFDGFIMYLGVAQTTDWQPSTNNESGSFDLTLKIDTIKLKQV